MPKVEPSKNLPPATSGIIHRSRLVRRLQENEDHRLIVILGQAAQGKSTLAASFAQASSLNSVWINLGPEDDNAVNLYYATASPLSIILDAERLTFLLDYPASQLGPREPEALYGDWVSALFSEVNPSIRIIFDGLDRLADGSDAIRFLRVMLDKAPANIKFMLLSRKEPPFALHDWKIKQQACILSNKDLGFTYQETRSFLRQHVGASCDEEHVRKAWQSTEGWVGGLVLLSQVLRNADDSDSERQRIKGLPDRFQAEVFLYFAQEIFARLSEHDAWILLRSSLFGDVSPRFLDELLDIHDSEGIFQELARRNLFVHLVHDSAQGRVYRYHQLFREFLQKIWQERTSAEERKRFLRRTARACAKRKDLESAVELFLQAETLFPAAAVLKVLGREMLQTGRHHDLAWILNRFPERVVQTRPWLLLYRAYCRRYSHAAENVKELSKAEGMFRSRRDIRGLLMTLASLMEAIMLQGRDRISIHELVAKGEELLSQLDFGQYPREQALLWLQMGFCYSLRGENTRDGYRASQNAFHLAKKINDRPLQIQALVFSIIPLTFLGEFEEGDKLRSQVENMLQKSGYPELEALFLKMWSELVMFAGRLDLGLAHSIIERLKHRIEQYGLLYVKAPAMYSEFAYHMYAGNGEKAEEIGLMLQDMAEAIDNTYGRGFCLILRGLLSYRQGHLSQAKGLIEAGLEIFRQPEARSYLHDYEFSIGAGLIHTHLGNWQEAESLLLRSLQYFTDISSQLARTEALLSLALLYELQGNRTLALEYLESGLSIASVRQYSHFVILSPRDQVSLCLLALEAGSKASREYAAHLLHTGLCEAVAAQESRLQSHPSPRVRRAIHAVLQQRHRRQRTQVYIQSLGKFRVWVGQRELSDADWAGNQAKALLKALVALAFDKQVRKEFLIDELWPDSNPGAGEKTFKVALHRLRRSLEPDMSPRFGSSYIHLKNGLLFLDQELCATDVQRFSRLCSRTENLLQGGEGRQALKRFTEAVSLYKGDFLPEDTDTEWMRAVREHLRQRYIALLLETAEAHERNGSWTKAVGHYQKALDCDPLLEEAYRRIMVLYADRGKRSKALSVFETCRKNLQQALGIEPDDLTLSVYRRIRG